MKRWLAVHRWWITGFTLGLLAVRIAVAVGIALAGATGVGQNAALSVATAAMDALTLGLAVVALVSFVQYGRIFNARVPTE